MNTKKCTVCKIEKELSEENFNKRTDSLDGFRSDCRDCRFNYNKTLTLKRNPNYFNLLEEREQLVLLNQKRCTFCKEIKDLNNFSVDKNKYGGVGERCHSCRMNEHYVKSYGITKAQFILLCEKQNYICLICDNKFELGHNYQKGIRFANLDHCHKTNKIRGVLCNKCNQALGLLDDSIKILEKAKQYLNENISN